MTAAADLPAADFMALLAREFAAAGGVSNAVAAASVGEGAEGGGEGAAAFDANSRDVGSVCLRLARNPFLSAASPGGAAAAAATSGGAAVLAGAASWPPSELDALSVAELAVSPHDSDPPDCWTSVAGIVLPLMVGSSSSASVLCCMTGAACLAAPEPFSRLLSEYTSTQFAPSPLHSLGSLFTSGGSGSPSWVESVAGPPHVRRLPPTLHHARGFQPSPLYVS